MPRKKKEVNPESEDQLYERFLKKLLKDPRFKQLKPVIMKALGGGRGGRGTGGRSQGMLQTPNQDNFTKIHSSILDTNARLADLSNQMKRGQFEQYMYWQAAQQGYQGNAQHSPNIPPPKNEQISITENRHRSLSRSSIDLDDLSEQSFRRLGGPADSYAGRIEETEAEQGHVEDLPNIPPPQYNYIDKPRELTGRLGRFNPDNDITERKGGEIVIQTEIPMYSEEQMLSKMSRPQIEGVYKAHGLDVRGLPGNTENARRVAANRFNEEHHARLMENPAAIELNLTRTNPRGRPLRPDEPIIQPIDELSEEEG